MWIQDNWYDEKVIFLNAYIDTHQKSSCRGKEMRTKDTASKYFLEVLRTNSPSMINPLPSLFFELVIIYLWKCWNREQFREIHI